MRLFHIADINGLEFHPAALKQVTRSLSLITPHLRENEEANRLFRSILTSRRNPELILRRMNEAGVLGRFIPEFGKIVSMMQFNMPGQLVGRSPWLQPVNVDAKASQIGDIIRVRITKAGPNSLFAEMIGESDARS